MAEELTRADIVEIMRGERFVMMTSVAADGTLQSYPMTPQEVTEEAVVRFFIGLQGDQAENLRKNGQVNLAFAEAGSWLSVAGKATFVEDRAKIAELIRLLERLRTRLDEAAASAGDKLVQALREVAGVGAVEVVEVDRPGAAAGTRGEAAREVRSRHHGATVAGGAARARHARPSRSGSRRTVLTGSRAAERDAVRARSSAGTSASVGSFHRARKRTSDSSSSDDVA